MTQAGSPTTEVWYIEDGLEKKGPFTIEQIQDLLNRGEIQASTRIFGNGQMNDYTTVIDILKSRSDPDYSLFDVLQTAKEHRTGPIKKEGLHEVHYHPVAPTETPSSPRLWILVLSTAISMLLTWGVFQILKKTSPTLATPTLDPPSRTAGIERPATFASRRPATLQTTLPIMPAGRPASIPVFPSRPTSAAPQPPPAPQPTSEREPEPPNDPPQDNAEDRNRDGDYPLPPDPSLDPQNQ